MPELKEIVNLTLTREEASLLSKMMSLGLAVAIGDPAAIETFLPNVYDAIREPGAIARWNQLSTRFESLLSAAFPGADYLAIETTDEGTEFREGRY